MLESSFFAMTMRTRGALGQRLVRARLGAARALDVDDALVGVARELVEEARVEAGDADEDEPRLGLRPPHDLGRVEKVDVALVPLLAADVEDERRVRGYPVCGAEGLAVGRAGGVRAHPRPDEARRIHAARREPGPLPVRHRGDDVRAAVAVEVARHVAAVELSPMRAYARLVNSSFIVGGLCPPAPGASAVPTSRLGSRGGLVEP